MSADGRAVRGFCPRCCTRHDLPGRCPGPVQATGPERPGWSATYRTPAGREVVVVVIAPAAVDLWCARILSLPNGIWTVPGAAGAMKFLGRTDRDAGIRARAWVEEHAFRVGWTALTGAEAAPVVWPPAVLPPVDERPIERRGGADRAPALRKICSLPVRYGLDRGTIAAVVRNVSETGLFVRTERPPDAGADLRMTVDLGGCTMPLRGVVVWNRPRPESGRESGMGIRLLRPPALFVGFVRGMP